MFTSDCHIRLSSAIGLWLRRCKNPAQILLIQSAILIHAGKTAASALANMHTTANNQKDKQMAASAVSVQIKNWLRLKVYHAFKNEIKAEFEST